MPPMLGMSRPLRVPRAEVACDAGSDQYGPYIELRFFLPSGSYALSVMREICKLDIADEADAGTAEDNPE